ncbi:cytochrome P450 [Micromonospora terminaliae]|uniref:Cytochrome P450 n=1 Tax=Micromonospora terminaliae TaxID=1914461 RepID=A0AAJ2ZLV1_9ACTN|nr:cytochrome P450 [Micromonospora terminaliae]NES31614.1 cytochrome P450 [Micromonospora terminaliae]QGL46198.1 cytochrome P450 [Micromonospora terminaliae]
MRWNPFAGAYLADPAQVWRGLLESPGGVHHDEALGLWLITRHADVRRALGDTGSFRNALTLAPVYEVCPEALAVIMQIDAPPTTAAADPPVHPRTRRALRATFANTADRVEQRYGALVRRRVDELVARLLARAGQQVDLVAEFTTELPLLVLLDLLGVPERDIARVRAWADGQIALVWGRPEPAEQVRLAQGLLEFWRYCQALVRDRLDGGGHGDGYVDQLIAYRNGDDDVLTVAEVSSIVFNLLVAGHETTAGLLAHALDQALTDPGRWRAIAAESHRVPAFLTETLRFAPAIDGWLRVTSRPVTLDGVTIPAGARCLLLIGAANRDPAVFAHPDRFDPRRADANDHLSFGHGPHFCIGAALARLEAGTALTRLAAAVPGLRLAPGHRRSYQPNVAFRAHRGLPVVVDTAAPAVRRAAA